MGDSVLRGMHYSARENRCGDLIVEHAFHVKNIFVESCVKIILFCVWVVFFAGSYSTYLLTYVSRKVLEI